MTMLAIAPPEKFRQAVIAGLRDRLILKLGGLCQNSGYDPRQIARRSLAVNSRRLRDVLRAYQRR
jgi:hypothetical protein